MSATQPAPKDRTYGFVEKAASLLPSFIKAGKAITIRGEPHILVAVDYEHDNEYGNVFDRVFVEAVSVKDIELYIAGGYPSVKILAWEGDLSGKKKAGEFSPPALYAGPSKIRKKSELGPDEIGPWEMADHHFSHAAMLNSLSDIALGKVVEVKEQEGDPEKMVSRISSVKIIPSSRGEHAYAEASCYVDLGTCAVQRRTHHIKLNGEVCRL